MEKQQVTETWQIQSAKTRKHKDGRVLDAKYLHVRAYGNGRVLQHVVDAKAKGDAFCHPDLLKSLKAFVPHFMLASEQATLNDFTPDYFKKKKYEKDSFRFEVTGIHIKDKDDRLSVILVGRQVLKNGRVISMVPPQIQYQVEEGDEDVYPYHKELKAAVDAYLTECEEYFAGKLGTSAQGELFNGDPEEEEETKVRKIS